MQRPFGVVVIAIIQAGVGSIFLAGAILGLTQRQNTNLVVSILNGLLAHTLI